MVCLAAAVALGLFPLSLAAQDEEALRLGQKYLDKVAEVWAASLPQERLCGVYIGRKWVGSMKMTVKKAPSDSGAAFAIATEARIGVGGRVTLETNGRALVARNLAPVSIESTRSLPDGTEKCVVTVDGNTWKRSVQRGEEVTKAEGEVNPGATCEVLMLFLFAQPNDDGLALIDISEDTSPCWIRKLVEKKKRTFGKGVVECSVVEVKKEGKPPDMWFVSPEGKALELVSQGIPLRFRPISEGQIGKSIDEPVELEPPARALVDLFLAIKKNDEDAVRAAYDFERFACMMDPGFAALSAEEREASLPRIRESMLRNLLAEELRSSLPEVGLLEESVGGSMESVVKDGVARIRVFGNQTWQLYDDGKGKWRVFFCEED